MPEETTDELRQPIAVEITRGERLEDEGPLGWFRPVMETVYAPLSSREEAAPRGAPEGLSMASPEPGRATISSLEPARDVRLVRPGPAAWRDVLREYRQRQRLAGGAAPAAAFSVAPGAPFLPGGRNWFALGPTVVLEGQTVGHQPVGGRVSGLAIAPGATVMYAATASGGVFRSLDGGLSWESRMDGFDLDPTAYASASLVCGAIAISPADPQRVYVGTGEGDTHEMFSRRVTSALPAYRGVGPLRSDDGGTTWISETSRPDLAGHAFFALAVDPRNPENVVGATSWGLYQRVPARGDGEGGGAGGGDCGESGAADGEGGAGRGAGGAFEWVRRRPGVHSSVVVERTAEGTRFFAAEWGGEVLASRDGETWSPVGTGFPASDVGRIALGVAGEGGGLYAFAADVGGGLRGLYRLERPVAGDGEATGEDATGEGGPGEDGQGGFWEVVRAVPDVLPGRQGDYDLAIVVDPADSNRVYLGGDRAGFDPWPASVWRCEVERDVQGRLRVTASRSIGHQAHADVHVLAFTPGDPDELWCGCDGGIFLNRDPAGGGEFAGHNQGLACLCCNFLGQHPTDPNVLYTGLQDNGTARTGGSGLWRRVQGGDGGYCVVSWDDPDLVLVFANGTVYRSTSGGAGLGSWDRAWSFPWATMTQPIVTTPRDPDDPAAAGWVAVGAGRQVSVSSDFAASWSEGFLLPGASGNVFALAFARSDRLFVGSTAGRIFRADRVAGEWKVVRIDEPSAGGPPVDEPLGVTGLVTEVAVDWADEDRRSIYVTFGGFGDTRRVWHFDGRSWESRSGSPGRDLLDVEHNALVVDPRAPENLYVGANIGVWHSPDAGHTWSPLQNGLPDAPVFDLQIHPTQRLLRAATHGRGLYEIALE